MKKLWMRIIVLMMITSITVVPVNNVKGDSRYGVILEPTMEYDYVFGFYNGKVSEAAKATNTSGGSTTYKYGYIPVKINGKWGIYKVGEGEKQSDNPVNNLTGNPANNSAGNPVDNSTGNQQNTNTEQTTTLIIGTKTDCPPGHPARVKIKKITKGRKKAKVILKKIKSVSGYVVQYSTYKNFKKVKKITTKKTKITVKKLKSKKVYYFRAVAYKTYRGTRFYSTKWSKTKKVKIK